MRNQDNKEKIIEILKKRLEEENNMRRKLSDPMNLLIQFGIVSGIGNAIDHVARYFDDIEENKQ